MRSASAAISFAIHFCLIGLVVYLSSVAVLRMPPMRRVRLVPVPAPHFKWNRQSPPGSGGGHRDESPARRGVPPPRGRFLLPITRPLNDNPRLVVAMLEAPPELHMAGPIGDPLSNNTIGGLGQNCCKGIGDGPGNKVGDGDKDGPPGRYVRVTQPPRLIYKVEPEFSEEARKAKFQGTVTLSIEVDAAGKVRNPHIVQSLGLGLDEKAIEAVLLWKFQPAYANGKAVATPAVVEVNFRLL